MFEGTLPGYPGWPFGPSEGQESQNKVLSKVKIMFPPRFLSLWSTQMLLEPSNFFLGKFWHFVKKISLFKLGHPS